MLPLSLVVSALVLAAGASPAALPRAEPQTIQLKARQVAPGSIMRRAVSPVTVPLKDYFNGTDLQYGRFTMCLDRDSHLCVLPGGSAILPVRCFFVRLVAFNDL